jgi:hypothetical protein
MGEQTGKTLFQGSLFSSEKMAGLCLANYIMKTHHKTHLKTFIQRGRKYFFHKQE